MTQLEIPSGGGRKSPSALNRFDAKLLQAGLPTLERSATTVLQVNMGKLCNQACKHCHVEAGPKRTEIMEAPVMRRVIELAAHPAVEMVDLTGGAPEMNPHFRQLVERVSALGKTVMVRCNLTITQEPGFAWLPEFYAANRVHLVCSLPCYTPENVNRQRGKGVFGKSIAALRQLNQAGYAAGGEGIGGVGNGNGNGNGYGNGNGNGNGNRAPGPDALLLDLVYNPLGPVLPPDQDTLEADYKRELMAHFGVRFSRLLTLTNLPIGRFSQHLKQIGSYQSYLELLESSFNADTLPNLMCRNTLSIGWDGQIYDCDFNQMLEMSIGAPGASILDAEFTLEGLAGTQIRTGKHCLGCTAGAGSSCGGALT